MRGAQVAGPVHVRAGAGLRIHAGASAGSSVRDGCVVAWVHIGPKRPSVLVAVSCRSALSGVSGGGPGRYCVPGRAGDSGSSRKGVRAGRRRHRRGVERRRLRPRARRARRHGPGSGGSWGFRLTLRNASERQVGRWGALSLAQRRRESAVRIEKHGVTGRKA